MISLMTFHCDAARRRRGYRYRSYVTDAARHADNVTYHFENLHEPQHVSGTRPDTTYRPNNLENVMNVSTDPNHVSAISLCQWYTSATYDPYRVHSFFLFLFLFFFLFHQPVTDDEGVMICLHLSLSCIQSITCRMLALHFSDLLSCRLYVSLTVIFRTV